jgi:hypothetical protein
MRKLCRVWVRRKEGDRVNRKVALPKFRASWLEVKSVRRLLPFHLTSLIIRVCLDLTGLFR